MILIFMDIPVFAGKPKNPQSPWPHVAKFSDYLCGPHSAASTSPLLQAPTRVYLTFK